MAPQTTSNLPILSDPNGVINVNPNASTPGSDANAKNPQLGVDAFVKRLGVTPEVAKATLARECCGRVPSFEAQADPHSPYSMTSKEGE